jgi:glycine cleavage system H protein
LPEYLQTTVDKFTFKVATDRSYSPDGIWLQDLSEGRARVGVTDFVQQHSGDLAFASVKATGTTVAAGDEFAELETVKVNLSLPLPIAGTIVEVNPALDANPELVNQHPYGDGWLAVIQAAGWEVDRVGLLDPPAYLSVMQSQAEQDLNQP